MTITRVGHGTIGQMVGYGSPTDDDVADICIEAVGT